MTLVTYSSGPSLSLFLYSATLASGTTSLLYIISAMTVEEFADQRSETSSLVRFVVKRFDITQVCPKSFLDLCFKSLGHRDDRES